MNENSLKVKSISGLFWIFMERIGAQVVSFIVSIILARILYPEEYGLVALVTVFISILNVFISNSFSQALVQRKDVDEIDFSSVFYFNIVFSVALYALLYFSAPFIASFYTYDLLIPVIRVMGIQILISAVKSVQQAYVSRKMEFKKFFWSTIGGTAISAIVGIVMAYRGFGVWALVAQHLTNSFIDAVVLFVTVRWHPIWKFSFSRLSVLISYGWKVLVSALIDTVYDNLRSLIIGKKYSNEDLAYYNRGKQFPYLLVENINSSIASVLFPAMSKKQDDVTSVKAMTRRSINISAYILIPMMVGMAVVAKPMVLLLLTEKWLPCVPFVQIICFNAALMPIQTANGQAILAIGRSDITVKLGIIKKGVSIVIIFLAAQVSVTFMAVAGMFTAVFCTIVNAYPNKKLLGYSYFEQIKDIIPYIAMSAVMAGSIYWMIYLSIPIICQLLLQIVVGSAIYLALSLLFKIDSFQYITRTVLTLIKSKREK